MTVSTAPAWTHLDADPERTHAELTRSFPHACIWLGEYTGSWWALVRDRSGRSALLEGRTPAALYAELRAFHLQNATAADGSWTSAHPPQTRGTPTAPHRPPQTGRPPTTVPASSLPGNSGSHRPCRSSAVPDRPPATVPASSLPGNSGSHRPCRSSAVPDRPPATVPATSSPSSLDPYRSPRTRRPSAAPPSAILRRPATGRHDGSPPHRRRTLVVRVVSWLRGRRHPGGRDT